MVDEAKLVTTSESMRLTMEIRKWNLVKINVRINYDISYVKSQTKRKKKTLLKHNKTKREEKKWEKTHDYSYNTAALLYRLRHRFRFQSYGFHICVSRLHQLINNEHIYNSFCLVIVHRERHSAKMSHGSKNLGTRFNNSQNERRRKKCERSHEQQTIMHQICIHILEKKRLNWG